MKLGPTNLLEIAGIRTPLVGFYDVPDLNPFDPFCAPKTFFVNPDQQSLLLLGTEYHNAAVDIHPTFTTFGSGCGQLAALFGKLDPDIPRAIIGATDVAMREHLPRDILALTVNKPMYEQLCALDENSLLYKPFWKRLREARGEATIGTQ